jgi:hypothetical protein
MSLFRPHPENKYTKDIQINKDRKKNEELFLFKKQERKKERI